MSRFSRNRASRFGYVLEFLIIVTGIMISFLLNEYREEKALEKHKINILHEVNYDLTQDSVMLSISVDIYKKLNKSHDSLLVHFNDNELILDSLNMLVDHLVSYYPFKENRTTYNKIISDNSISIRQEDSLINQFMVLHAQVYSALHEWIDVDKEFVLNSILPYMERTAPYYPAPEGKSFSGEVYNNLKMNDEFKNYVKSGKIYKSYLLKAFEWNLNYVTKLKIKLNNYLKSVEEE